MPSLVPCRAQQARELVVEIIKDQGDFRSGRGDFGSRLGGSSLDVSFPSSSSHHVLENLAEQKNGGEKKKPPLRSQVAVPRFAVGIVIGRNGEMIKKIQNDAGVRIQFKPGGQAMRCVF